MDVDGNGSSCQPVRILRPLTDSRAPRLEWSFPPTDVDEGDGPQVDSLPRVVQRPDSALGPVRLAR